MFSLRPPIAAHDRIATCAQFAWLATSHDPIVSVDDFDLNVRHDTADGGDPHFDRVVTTRLKTDGTRLCHPIRDRDFRHVHVRDNGLHDFRRTRRSRHNAPAQRDQVKFTRGRANRLLGEMG